SGWDWWYWPGWPGVKADGCGVGPSPVAPGLTGSSGLGTVPGRSVADWVQGTALRIDGQPAAARLTMVEIPIRQDNPLAWQAIDRQVVGAGPMGVAMNQHSDGIAREGLH